MEEDLNRTSFRGTGDSAGWPTPERAPRTSRADSCEPSQGTEPYCPEGAAQPQVAIPVIIQGPPKEGNAATVGPVAAQTQATGPADGSCVDERGGGPEGSVHGAEYGGYLPYQFNSSLVDDDEAAARLEYHYQKVQRQASRTNSHGDTGGRPRSGVRGSTPRSSLDGRQGESQSSTVLQRMEGVMTRMERQLAASTSAIASMSAAHVLPSGPGEYISFLSFELLKYRLYCSNFILTFFIVIICPAYVDGLVHHVTESIT
jgi:hypothetical protein